MSTAIVDFAGYQFEPDRACLICDHVFDNTKQVFQVAHDADGWIQFFCDQRDHKSDETKVASLSELLQRHPYLGGVPIVHSNQYATRQPDGSWVVRAF